MNRSFTDSPGGPPARYKVYGHERLTASPTGDPLPNLPHEASLRRVVVRPKGDVTFTLDASDPADASAMYILADEIVVLDTDGASVLIAGAGVDVRLIYLGAG